jgi:GNAT superfamily N-acetyltransferase
MEFLIRKALQSDSTRLARLLHDLHYFDRLQTQPFEDTRVYLARYLALCLADDSHSVYVAEADGEILGYAAVHWLPYLFLPGPEGYVSELFVSDAARGQGIGTALLAELEGEARRGAAAAAGSRCSTSASANRTSAVFTPASAGRNAIRQPTSSRLYNPPTGSFQRLNYDRP